MSLARKDGRHARKLAPYCHRLAGGLQFEVDSHPKKKKQVSATVPKERLKEDLGSTLDVYGGKPEWIGNVEAAKKMGAAIEQAVLEAEQAEEVKSIVSLTAKNEKDLQAVHL